jgi:hypothetical protein
MTIIEIIVLILAIVGLAGVIGYQLTKGQPSLKDMVQDIKAEQVANELYNKDLRPTPEKKAPKKREVTSQDITQEVIKKVVEIAKVTPEAATVNLEAVVEKVKETKPEFPIDKPKKKRKYYPKKPKTSI